MTKVPLLDLKAQYAAIRDEILPVIASVCDSQHFILGEHVRAFEAEVARYCGASAGIGVSSGTDALLLALMAFGIGAGDEVITSPFTFFATAGTIARSGARPVFCDIDPGNFNLSAAAVEDFIERQCRVDQGALVNRSTGGRIRALMPVHLYGQAADMDPLVRIARRHGLRIIEDAAQAIGTEYTDGVRVGSIGDIGCFSFFPSKNLGAFGDAGLCTTNDLDLAEHLRVLRVHGGKPKYYHALIGGNFRIDELQAAILPTTLRRSSGRVWRRASSRRVRLRAAATSSINTRSAPSAATRFAPLSPIGGSEPRFITPCRCIFSNVLRIWATRAVISPNPSAPPKRRWRCRCIRNSRSRSSTRWSPLWSISTAELLRAPQLFLKSSGCS
jgi:dTDP-4-amino-4,6-dideoxygalactose transaminase